MRRGEEREREGKRGEEKRREEGKRGEEKRGGEEKREIEERRGGGNGMKRTKVELDEKKSS